MFNKIPQQKVSQKTKEELKKLNQDLVYAVYYYDNEDIKKSIEEGADVNVHDARDINDNLMRSPIHAAIDMHNLPALKILLQRGARVATVNERNVPALTRAVVTGSFHMVQELLLYGADCNTYYGCSVLESAIEELPSLAIIKYSTWPTPTLRQKLLDWFEQKGEFSIQDPEGEGIPFPQQTVPLRASYKGMQEIIALLLSKNPHVWIPNDRNVTILDLLEDPIKYKREFLMGRKDINFVNSVDKDILTFELEINNRNNSAPPIKVIVDYDLREIRKRIQTYVELSSKHTGIDANALSNGLNGKISDELHDLHKQSTSHLDQRLREVQQSLQLETLNLHQRLQEMRKVGNFDRKEERNHFIEAIKGHTNAEEAYKNIQIGLKAIMTSALAVKGGGVTVSDGSLSMVSSVLGLTTNLTDMIPVVGSYISKLFEAASTITKTIDTKRQTNTFENISALATDKEANTIFESVARKLVTAYFQQFNRIATEEKVKSRMNGTKKFLENAKQKTLKSVFKSPSEQVTAFAIIWMIEEIFYNVHNLKDEIKEKGLEAVLLEVVTKRKPTEKLKTFWNEISKKLNMDAIPTLNESGEISDKSWHPYDFWTLPGVIVVSEIGHYQYFSSVKNNPQDFGWRMGSMSDVEALGLQLGKEALPSPISSSYSRDKVQPITQNGNSNMLSPALNFCLPINLPTMSAPANLYPPLPNTNNSTNHLVTFGYTQQYQNLPPFNPECLEQPSAPSEEQIVRLKGDNKSLVTPYN